MLCVPFLCVFVIEENVFFCNGYVWVKMWVGRWWWWRARRWEGGGGRILDFRRNTNPSHLPLTSTRNWPKSLSIFNNHVTNCSSCWIKVWKSRGPLLDYLSSHWSMRAIALYVLRLYIRDAHSDLPVSGVFVSSTVRIMYKERGMGHAGPMSKLPKYCSPQSRLRITWSIGSDVNPNLPKMAKKWQIMFCY